MKNHLTLSGNIVDVVNRKIFPGVVEISNGMIQSVIEKETDSGNYILPGLVDAHVHIESSMLIPSEFARLAVVHGTVATVSDPHEIANVLGMEGIKFMLENSETVPFKFNFGAPSCVPATPFESSGAELGPEEVRTLLKDPRIKYLSEMMNFPGVLNKDPGVMAKLEAAASVGKPVDGHAPGLNGDSIREYIQSGISTDHECFTLDEALEKIKWGMKVQIREGSAAKNFETLAPLLGSHPEMVMLCSDDKHPDDLLEGHINLLVSRALKLGYDLFDVLRACTVVPVEHYKLDVGLLQENDPADLVVVDNLDDFGILETYISGELVAQKGQSKIDTPVGNAPNIFKVDPLALSDLEVSAKQDTIRVIQAMEGQLVTRHISCPTPIKNGQVVSDPERDLLKIIVLNRYKKAEPAIGFINGIGLKRGALASTVAHDSHNIVAVGCSDEELLNAVNGLMETGGGITLYDGDQIFHLPLPVAGIMSNQDGLTVAKKYELINNKARDLGTPLAAPFMTLSFMALLVIPELKLSDKGLFDGNRFEFVSLFDGPA